MDPDLAPFLRRAPKQLTLQHSCSLDDTITCLCIATQQDSRVLLAIGQADSSEILVLSDSLAVVRHLPGHAGGTNALAYSASSSKLVSAGEDGTAAVWDPDSGDLLARLECEGENVDRSSKGHTVSHAVCNSDGTLAAVAAGRSLHVFELTGSDYESRRRVFPPVPGGVIEDVKFVSTGGTRILCAYYGGVVLHSVEPGTSGLQLEYGTNIMSVAATPDLQYIIGGCMDTCVHIWHFDSSSKADPAAQSQPNKGSTAGTAEAAAEGKEDQQPQLSLPQLTEYSCGGYSSKVTSIQFNGSSSMLATLGGSQCTVWDFASPEGPAGTVPVVTLGHTKTLTCQAWQPVPDSPLLVTGGKDGRVLVFDVSEYAEPPEDEDDVPVPKFSAPVSVAPDPDLRDEVTALVWSHSSPKLLYAAHASGELRCWQLDYAPESGGAAAEAQ